MKRTPFLIAVLTGAALALLIYLLHVAFQTPATPIAFTQDRVVPTSSQAGPLTLDARLSQSHLLVAGDGNVHLGITLDATSLPGALPRTPLDLVLVMDTSGSMAGERIQHAKTAATLLLDQLQDGDRFALVTYSSTATATVPATLVSRDTWATLRAAIASISVSGNTCISCGLETARAQLSTHATRAQRVLLLSDGMANRGITELAELAHFARKLDASGTTLTTIGVGLGYHERLMSQLAIEGNGNHHFVQSPDTLQSTLATELHTLQQLVAHRATLEITLPDHVRFIRGYHRHFEIAPGGRTLTVSLGDIAAHSTLTVLAELQANTAFTGQHPIAHVTLRASALGESTPLHARTSLHATFTPDTQRVASSIDPDVSARIHQAHLAQTLERAHQDIAEGRIDKARERLSAEVEAARSLPLWGTHDGFTATVGALGRFEDSIDAQAAEASAKEGEVLRRELAR